MAAALPAAAVSATRAALSRDASNAGEAVPRAADALIAVFDFDGGCLAEVVFLALLRVFWGILGRVAVAAECGVDSIVIWAIGRLDVAAEENE